MTKEINNATMSVKELVEKASNPNTWLDIANEYSKPKVVAKAAFDAVRSQLVLCGAMWLLGNGLKFVQSRKEAKSEDVVDYSDYKARHSA